MDSVFRIAIIIPVYNNVHSVRNVILEVQESGFNTIVVVDDGSEEPILSEIKGLNAQYIRHKVNLGQGAALQTGFEYVKSLGFEIAVTFDADGQHDAKDIAGIVEPLLRDKCDIVLGSRFKNKKAFMPSGRRIILQCARWVNYLFTGILLTDAHNGLRALNQRALQAIHITENRMAHATQIIAEIKKSGLRYREQGVNIRYTDYSKGAGQSSWNSIVILFDLIMHNIFK